MKTAVVIPAHNEGQTIGPLVKAVKGLGFDCIVINDGSMDNTEAAASKEQAVVLKTPAKSGKGKALALGFDYAMGKGYEALITMDGDGQHSPSDIGAFVACCRNTGADIVNGNRMNDPRGMPALRLATNHVMSWLISLICRQHIADTQCGFRLICTRVLQTIRLESSDFEIETEVLIKASKKGFKIVSVDIQTIYNDEVSKIQPLRDTCRFIAYLWRELSRKNG
ncbi:MAG: glycosyltransferase family 2 protein [Candidatus Omnitrophica bacterium]|nr:glycosyltransferase family 2 protein [Candidatus Omnitrophota bacterium]MDE2009996.1 glycosyltransferase family 2 protein [Candidatus Omnitrophota bacterium]MDE2215320.1 glycosyltransferase family 2 protein [Candidatus Omnitrophota bacterium]MDE2231728.1 glycosyltransferase family 2 protein [Candidatus Omnitrophota bacterium]